MTSPMHGDIFYIIKYNIKYKSKLTSEQSRFVTGSLDRGDHDVEHVTFTGHLYLDGPSLSTDMRFEFRIVQHDTGTGIIREPF